MRKWEEKHGGRLGEVSRSVARCSHVTMANKEEETEREIVLQRHSIRLAGGEGGVRCRMMKTKRGMNER